MNTNNNTLENNKLLAEFLGYKNIANDEDKQDYLNDVIKFHTDWNWLMKVVDKFNSLDCNYKIEISTYTSIDTLPIINHNKGTMFENTYNACIEFVKWYNENK